MLRGWIRSFSSSKPWEPPRRRPAAQQRRAPADNARKDSAVFAAMGALVVAFPAAISLVKGLEKRFMWKPAPAEIEAVEEGKVRYVYSARGKLFRHEQELFSRPNKGGEAYMPGDRIFVHVHTRNEALSILDPPLFQRIWRDFGGDPYKGAQIQ